MKNILKQNPIKQQIEIIEIKRDKKNQGDVLQKKIYKNKH